MTTGAFKPVNSKDGACSLEMWVSPDAADKDGTIVTFFRPDNHAVLFAVRQSLSDLELKHGPPTRRPAMGARIYADNVFRSPRSVFFTITSGTEGTKVYSDRRLVARYPDFKLSLRDFTGRLMIGNAPGVIDGWSGEIRGIAIYSRELSADEVVENSARWAHGDANALAGLKDLLALYRFNEGAGNVVHNQIETATDLHIPEHFFVLNKPFLEAPWDEFYMGWSYWTNLALNAVAFVPLGLAFCALLWSTHLVERRLLVTISFGFAVSLTIEVLQAFLPTRKSGATDLFTNTLGTALGAMCYRYISLHHWHARIAHWLVASKRPVEEGPEGIH
jgi:hypothetical protein